MAGYSKRPLAQKLGIAEGSELYLAGAPADYQTLVAPLPAGVTIVSEVAPTTDLIHHFTTERAELAAALDRYLATMRRDATIWISWPKKASRVPTDVTEDVIRDEALPRGLVDVKVCAVDAIWSGLKLVIRKALR